MNLGQFKDPVHHMCLAGTVVASWSLTREVAGLSPFTVMINMLVTEFAEFCKMYLPVRFKLGVSFSPLQGYHNHSIENKKASYWNSPVSHENHNRECQVDMTRIFKELRFHTFPILHAHLQH